MNEPSTSGKMQPWLKFVIAVVVLGVLATVGILIAGGFWLVHVAREASDPKAVAKASREIVKLPEPLPKGWTYMMAANLLIKSVLVRNSADNTVIQFTRYPQSMMVKGRTRGSTFESMVEGQQRGSGIRIEERGEGEVAGHKMEFVRGCTASGRRRMAMEVGSLLADNGDLVMIQAMEPDTAKYDPERVSPILSVVQSF